MAKIDNELGNIPRDMRYAAKQNVVVASKTIGSNLSYKLMTENISKSGMLLRWDQRGRIPFIEKTILEMSIDPGCIWLQSPIHCLGKVVRISDKKGQKTTGTRFGIKVLEYDSEIKKNWTDEMNQLSQSATPSQNKNIDR